MKRAGLFAAVGIVALTAGSTPAFTSAVAAAPAPVSVQDCVTGQSDAHSGPSVNGEDEHGQLRPDQLAWLDWRAQQESAEGLPPAPKKSITVKTRVNILHYGKKGKIPRATVNKQMSVMNKAFKKHAGKKRFKFKTKKVRYVNSRAFYYFNKNTDNYPMKRTLRRGGSKVLNIYVVRGIKNSMTSGYATFPEEYKDKKWDDGVVLDGRSFLGGQWANLNRGDNLVHEVGHWQGLLHTFQGRTNTLGDCQSPGDMVKDTPYHKLVNNSIQQCKKTNTCKSRKGNDPIHNYMNYTGDDCRNEFTKGQYKRMRAQWRTFRA